VVFERLHDGSFIREELSDLLGGGRSSRCGEVVPCHAVDRVRDVDHDLALDPVGVLADGVLDRGVVDGKDDDLASQRVVRPERGHRATELLRERARLLRVAVDDLHLVSARDGARADAAPHVARTDDRDLHRLPPQLSEIACRAP
jgi:hypothetical protein